MDSILTKIGINIKKYRESKSITQEELAKLCGVHRNYLISVEAGKQNLTVKTLEKIATGLNVKIERLFE